jgi:hypothetical protein
MLDAVHLSLAGNQDELTPVPGNGRNALGRYPLFAKVVVSGYYNRKVAKHETSQGWNYRSRTKREDAAAESFYVNLYGAIANGEPLKVTPQEVRRQIQVMEECFEQNEEFASKHRSNA